MKKLSTLALALLIITGMLSSAFTISGNGYSVGDKARDFSLKNVDGKNVSLQSNKKAKGYIVVFTCNECPFSKLYEDRIIALHNKYAPKGYPVVAINPNDPAIVPGDSYEMMQARAKEKKYPFPYLLDETQEIARTYGATNTPHIYILERTPDNQFEVKYIGAIDDNARSQKDAQKKYAENTLDELLKGKPVTQEPT
ncbi:MAG: thioredoxin family protein [Hymenobacteraceae bacterium]|nr:thioredoxin family protein [Hymenobacteraceae bacterium]MDX5395089.1 thioredoxin family protein [Hymenobacteraceae bacterium]MDX5511127.1 thioredoxin family protein [Hymenobacteraceae bacterium]